MLKKVKELLKEELKDRLSEEELSLLPSSYQKIGDILIINLKSELTRYEKEIGKILLERIPHTRTVCRKEGPILGETRKPKIKVIAGDENTETVHKEHGILFKLDVAKIMFAKGNLNERKRMARLVRGGEIIVDMFAGIGYFSLGIAKFANPKKIFSIEINPVAFHYFRENIKLNKVEDKIEPILGDCREIIPRLGRIADRVIMGLLPSCKEFLPYALDVVKYGGIIHYHGVAKKEEWKKLFEEVKKVAEKKRLRVKLMEKVKVKSYAPKVFHWVLDCLIE